MRKRKRQVLVELPPMVAGAAYHIELFDPVTQTVTWSEEIHNLVPTVGLNYFNQAALNVGTQAATLYIGLIAGPTPTLAAADTMSSHAGWTEQSANYSELVRQTWVKGSSSGGVVASTSAAVFTMTSAVSIAGAFIVDSATKGGTSGTLVSEGLLSSAVTPPSGQEVRISITWTLTST